MTAALAASGRGLKIDLYEQNSEPGRKILASGNGRCNISNISLSSEDYYGEHPSFVKPVLNGFDFKAFERFSFSYGLMLDVREDGRVYPLSNEARSVHEILCSSAKERGVNFQTRTFVESIDRVAGSFIIETSGRSERYDRVLLATGSPAAPQLGGGMSGLRMAEALGHRIVEPYPTLVGLHLKGSLHEVMSGVKCRAGITLYVDSKRRTEIVGDLLFTRYGVSGFGVLDISTEASHALRRGRNVSLGIDLMPGLARQGLVQKMEKIRRRVPQSSTFLMLHGFLPRRVVSAVVEDLKLDPKKICADLGPKEIRRIASTICDWRFEVSDTHGYRHAETAGGGVSTEDVDSSTMESKIVPGLHFSGEILDIVGRRGGYNLHFAWASGYLAGRAIRTKMSR